MVLAPPIALMVFPPPPPPLPHLARLPVIDGKTIHGSASISTLGPMVVDITSWPCSEPCIGRTAAMAALAHGPNPPTLLTVFTSAPDAHPAVDAAQAVEGWHVIQASTDRVEALNRAWFDASTAAGLDESGILVVDHTGSIRAVVPATLDTIDFARDHIAQLMESPPG